MAHSRIFQVSEQPIREYDYICESDFYDGWFLGSVADYVNEDCNRKEDIEWLKDSVNGFTFGVDENGNDYFIIKSKENYFANKFDGFKKQIEKLKDCSFEDFVYGLPDMFRLKELYNDKFGFYINGDYGLDTLDGFVRNASNGDKYYIGNTIDYHF